MIGSREPPYSAAELLHLHTKHCGAPVAMYGRRPVATPDAAAKSPAAAGPATPPDRKPTCRCAVLQFRPLWSEAQMTQKRAGAPIVLFGVEN
jgi:hypothetical protein